LKIEVIHYSETRVHIEIDGATLNNCRCGSLKAYTRTRFHTVVPVNANPGEFHITIAYVKFTFRDNKVILGMRLSSEIYVNRTMCGISLLHEYLVM
jgi:hypothetical protein